MRYPASEKLEIIRLVEQSHLSVKQTLDKLGKRHHYDNHEQLKQHLEDFINVYNYARRLKTLKGLTPYEFICKCWINEPNRFKVDPIHQRLGLSN